MNLMTDLGGGLLAPATSSNHLCLQPPVAIWRVLVIGEETDRDAGMCAALEGRLLFGRTLTFFHVRSEEARAYLQREIDIAVVMLCVPAQEPGLSPDLVGSIRQSEHLRDTRIVLRLNHLGQVPDLETLLRYDISDWWAASACVPERLPVMVVTAVRCYERLCAIEANRRRLELVVRSSATLLEQPDLHAFAASVIAQLAALLEVRSEGLVCVRNAKLSTPYRVLAAVGDFAALADQPLHASFEPRRLRALHRAIEEGGNIYDECGGMALFIGQEDEQNMAVFITVPPLHGVLDLQLLEVFSSNLNTLLHNRGLLERLREYAYYDPLVALPNRAYFLEKVDECVRLGGRDHVLALVDIDDFSASNDVMGHRFGDRLLMAVARCLAEALPPGVLLARVGSNAFGILGASPHVQPQSLLECVRAPLTVDGAPHQVSLTCGYVLLAGGSQAGVDLLKDATVALRRAKREHRGKHLRYSDIMGTEARERARLLSDLRAAIDKRQLFLVYQPQLSLDSRHLTGLEALLRWRTEDGRLIAPDQFIPVAEHSGLIVSLGQWALRTACTMMRELLESGLAPQRMAVNVSMAQLRDPGFVQAVIQALLDTGLQGSHLELEITESVAGLPTQLLESTLGALRAAGVSIAIDDFGTGYSSLSYLERLPLDRIKIDRVFVRQLEENQGARIVEMVAQLGCKLGLSVLAEGIESRETWHMLQTMGCHQGQGYYIAWPMNKTDLLDWLRTQVSDGCVRAPETCPQPQP
ncbi:MAG: EAL domain-containing protein [Rhodocyclaceae bacterium]